MHTKYMPIHIYFEKGKIEDSNQIQYTFFYF